MPTLPARPKIARERRLKGWSSRWLSIVKSQSIGAARMKRQALTCRAVNSLAS